VDQHDQDQRRQCSCLEEGGGSPRDLLLLVKCNIHCPSILSRVNPEGSAQAIYVGEEVVEDANDAEA